MQPIHVLVLLHAIAVATASWQSGESQQQLRSRQLSSSESEHGVCNDTGCPLSVVILAGGILGCLALLICFWRLMQKDWSTVKLAPKGSQDRPLPLQSRPGRAAALPELPDA